MKKLSIILTLLFATVYNTFSQTAIDEATAYKTAQAFTTTRHALKDKSWIWFHQKETIFITSVAKVSSSFRATRFCRLCWLTLTKAISRIWKMRRKTSHLGSDIMTR